MVIEFLRSSNVEKIVYLDKTHTKPIQFEICAW